MSTKKMSEFVVESVTGKKGRIGQLFLTSSANAVPLLTPGFFVHTQAGSVPHLTSEVMCAHVFPEERPPLLITLDSCLTFAEPLGKYGKGVNEFVGYKGWPTFLSPHNPLSRLRSGYNHGSSIAFWSRTGKRSLEFAEFKRLAQGFKATVHQVLSDYDVAPNSGKKRLKKSIQRTLGFLEEESKTAGDNGVSSFATIEASWFLLDEDEAMKAVQQIVELSGCSSGFTISGLALPMISNKGVGKTDSKNADECASLVNQCDLSTLERILSLLPENKPRYIPGPFAVPVILDLISKGVDLFDSSCVTHMTDVGDALVLDKFRDLMDASVTKVVEDGPSTNAESVTSNANIKAGDSSIISLKDKRYFSDFTSLSATCSCYTCRKHTRSYIHHLLLTDELLGPVLLMIHNLTAFNDILKIVQTTLRKDADDGSSQSTNLDNVREFFMTSCQKS